MNDLRVGFIGLGAMGLPMAGHLARAGLLRAVWNRSRDKAAAAAQKLHVAAPATIAELAPLCNVIALCVPADADVLDLVGEIAVHAHPGTIVIDHSTVSSVTAQSAHAILAKKDCAFLDAPVSGGVEGANNGKLSVMVGGDADTLVRVRPALDCYALKINHMGAVGAGQNTKAVN